MNKNTDTQLVKFLKGKRLYSEVLREMKLQGTFRYVEHYLDGCPNLNMAFIFAKSKRGHAFWWKLNKEFQEYAK